MSAPLVRVETPLLNRMLEEGAQQQVEALCPGRRPESTSARKSTIETHWHLAALLEHIDFPPFVRTETRVCHELTRVLKQGLLRKHWETRYGAREHTTTIRQSQRDLFSAYATSAQALRVEQDALKLFLLDIIRANIVLSRQTNSSDLCEDLARRILTPHVVETPRYDGGFDAAELALGSNDEIYAAMNNSLRRNAESLGAWLGTSIARLRAADILGHAEALSPTVWRFRYFRWTVADTVAGQSQHIDTDSRRSRTTTTTNIERTVYREDHRHDIIDADLMPWPAREIRMPERVRRLLDHLPATLRPATTILSGTEIYRAATRRHIHTEHHTRVDVKDETHVFQRDPAVLIGDTVLTGWTDDELR